MSEAVSASFHAWIDSRKQNSFDVFEPALSPLVQLKRQEADMLGYAEHPYNALMDEFEKGATVKMLDKILPI
jgi:carboxypeptidase Taq